MLQLYDAVVTIFLNKEVLGLEDSTREVQFKNS